VGLERAIASCDSKGMSTAKIGDLEIQIEELVREHVAALRRAATAAVERAFAQATARGAKGGRGKPAAREGVRRRASEEVAALGERLYAAICAHPGSAMTRLATEIGSTPGELNRPATQLRLAGRVRTVGQRHGTRYFPISPKNAGRA
jgi:acyl-CoA reductase-like NAD-dependent aldehyde dehydrogenase